MGTFLGMVKPYPSRRWAGSRTKGRSVLIMVLSICSVTATNRLEAGSQLSEREFGISSRD